MPYGYYQFLRLALTGYAGYVAYLQFQSKPHIWAWIFALIAVLYNPVFGIGMERDTHAIFNCLNALLIILEWRFGRGADKGLSLSNQTQSFRSSQPSDESAPKLGPLFLILIGAIATVLILNDQETVIDEAAPAAQYHYQDPTANDFKDRAREQVRQFREEEPQYYAPTHLPRQEPSEDRKNDGAPDPISHEAPNPRLEVGQGNQPSVISLHTVNHSKPGRARGNPGLWVTNDDYPAQAMREKRMGTSHFTVTYDQNGRITDCSIFASSGHADLDDETCRLVSRRGKFDPGIDESGAQIGGTYSNQMRWNIPQ